MCKDLEVGRLEVSGGRKASSLAGGEVIERHRVIGLRGTSYPTLEDSGTPAMI